MILDIEDTIVAPATPSGEGGVAIVRLSGPKSEEFLTHTFKPRYAKYPLESHRLYFGEFSPPHQNESIDEVMAVVMKKPFSYTREDVAEIHCHGSPVIVRQIINCFLDLGGRIARPGEFTLRAFANGRIDLSKAEAVADFIHARSATASQVAYRQLEGSLSRFVYSLRERLIQMASLTEAYIDFPDEEIELPHYTELNRSSSEICEEIDRVLLDFEAGRVLREGVSLLLLGRPNVGKSSLLNAFLGEARAIVTEIPGTTRDTIEESFVLGGVPLKIIDTAGVRHTDDPVEMEGVRRAREKIKSSDVVLLILDGSCNVNDEDFSALDAAKDSKLIVVQNKADKGCLSLSLPFSDLPNVQVSATEGTGLKDLQEKILHLIFNGSDSEFCEAPLISDHRHRFALIRAKEYLGNLQRGLKQELSPEFLSVEIRGALDALGEITGETTPDEILNQIFNRFCIGK